MSKQFFLFKTAGGEGQPPVLFLFTPDERREHVSFGATFASDIDGVEDGPVNNRLLTLEVDADLARQIIDDKFASVPAEMIADCPSF